MSRRNYLNRSKSGSVVVIKVGYTIKNNEPNIKT